MNQTYSTGFYSLIFPDYFHKNTYCLFSLFVVFKSAINYREESVQETLGP